MDHGYGRWRPANLHKRRGAGRSDLEKKFKIVPGLIRRQATLGTVEVNNLLGVDKLASHVIHLPPQTILKRRGGMATSFSAVPLA